MTTTVNLYNCTQHLFILAAIGFLSAFYTFIVYGISIPLGILTSLEMGFEHLCYIPEPAVGDTYDISTIDVFLGCPTIGFAVLVGFAVLCCFVFLLCRYGPKCIHSLILKCCGINLVCRNDNRWNPGSEDSLDEGDIDIEVLDEPPITKTSKTELSPFTELDMGAWGQNVVPVVIPYIPSAPPYNSLQEQNTS